MALQGEKIGQFRNEADKKDYGMAGDLNGKLESVVGNHVLLAGPLVDSFFMGNRQGHHREAKKKPLAGLVPPIVTFIPLQNFNNISSFCVGYVLFLGKEGGVQKIFHPKRFDGSYFLTKQKYEKKLKENNVSSTVYSGCAKVVVYLYTPIKLDYVKSTQQPEHLECVTARPNFTNFTVIFKHHQT